MALSAVGTQDKIMIRSENREQMASVRGQVSVHIVPFGVMRTNVLIPAERRSRDDPDERTEIVRVVRERTSRDVPVSYLFDDLTKLLTAS